MLKLVKSDHFILKAQDVTRITVCARKGKNEGLIEAIELKNGETLVWAMDESVKVGGYGGSDGAKWIVLKDVKTGEKLVRIEEQADGKVMIGILNKDIITETAHSDYFMSE